MQSEDEITQGKEFHIEEPPQTLPQWNVSENTRTRLIDSFCVFLNASSTILIVFLNK
jgi:solute carrier family 35 protein E3